jgi:4-diphosphocytidyl-2-C-methyl-D-erythritol kinase
VTRLRTAAPGKVNLCLYVGPARDDGLHELVSVVQPLDLADELTLEPADVDGVVCPGVEGENLAARALSAYRDASGTDGAHRLTIDKRVPVAAGMGGGSSDAAAALRLAAHAAGRPGDPLIATLAPTLGADVPALLHETATLVTRTGEDVTPIAGRALAGEVTYVVLPLAHRLSAGDVYAEADRLGLARPADALAVRRAEVAAALEAGGLPLELVHNDLEDAARSLCPAIDCALAAARAAQAGAAAVSGSGPTVFAIFAGKDAAAELVRAWPGAVATRPAPPGITEVRSA